MKAIGVFIMVGPTIPLSRFSVRAWKAGRFDSRRPRLDTVARSTVRETEHGSDYNTISSARLAENNNAEGMPSAKVFGGISWCSVLVKVAVVYAVVKKVAVSVVAVFYRFK